jgi:hypothetical protein
LPVPFDPFLPLPIGSHLRGETFLKMGIEENDGAAIGDLRPIVKRSA